MVKTDCLIIGAGIAGLTSSIYLKRANINFVILENLLPGGKLNILKKVDNYPGFSNVSGKEIIFSLMNQINDLGIKITYGSVVNILQEEDGFKIISDKETYLVKTIIVACGMKDNIESIKGEKEYFGKGVSYCATCDGYFFKNKIVAVYGNNNSAFEEALYLSSLAKKIYFICPDDCLNGSEELIESIKNKNIEIILNKTIEEISGDDFSVTSIKLNNGEILNADGIFPYVGKKDASTFLSNLNPTFVNNFLEVDKYMKTDIDGLFAAGDVTNNVLKQLVTSSSEGAIASMSVIKYLKTK